MWVFSFYQCMWVWEKLCVFVCMYACVCICVCTHFGNWHMFLMLCQERGVEKRDNKGKWEGSMSTFSHFWSTGTGGKEQISMAHDIWERMRQNNQSISASCKYPYGRLPHLYILPWNKIISSHFASLLMKRKAKGLLLLKLPKLRFQSVSLPAPAVMPLCGNGKKWVGNDYFFKDFL